MFVGESPVVNVVNLALDGLLLRQKAIAHNLANANTAGFAPVRVAFEEQLAQLAKTSAAKNAREMREQFAPEISSATSGYVAIDEELSRLSQTALQYQALTKALTKHYAILSTALGDNKSR